MESELESLRAERKAVQNKTAGEAEELESRDKLLSYACLTLGSHVTPGRDAEREESRERGGGAPNKNLQ